MNIDFDGLRKNIATAYNELVEILNDKVEDQSSSYNVMLDMDEIDKAVNDLRDGIATLICLYEENMGIKSMANMKLNILFSDYSD